MKALKPIIFSSLIVFLSLKVSFALPLLDSIQLNKNIDILSIFQTKCKEKETRIKNRIGNFEAKKERHMEIYNKLQDRLEQKITRWKEMGYDTDKLETDLEELNTMVDEFVAEYSDYIDTLRGAQGIVCTSDDDFDTAVEEAQDDLQDLREKASEIKNFYYNTIRPDILDLKEQTPSVEED